ncbi:MAG TPA: hypothetical protein VIG24_10520, partial [Acidimicrobiia bacterium]
TNTDVLGLDLGDPVIVEFTPPNVSQLTEPGVVLNLRHDFTIGMQPATLDGVMILGTGRLGFDALAF